MFLNNRNLCYLYFHIITDVMEEWKKYISRALIWLCLSIFFFVYMIFFFPRFSPYNQVDALVRVVPWIIFIPFWARKVRYAFSHRKDQFFYPDGVLVIKKGNLGDLVACSMVEGSGSIQDPYKFASLSSYPSRIGIYEIKSHFIIEGLNLKRLVLKSSKNIIVKDNKIRDLHKIISIIRITISE